MGRNRNRKPRQKAARRHPDRQAVPQHPRQEAGFQQTFRCYGCSTNYASHSGLSRHIHHGCPGHICRRCDAVFSTRNQLMGHVHRRDCLQDRVQLFQPYYPNNFGSGRGWSMYPDRFRPGGRGSRPRHQHLEEVVSHAVDAALARHSPYVVMNAVEDAFARNCSGYWTPNNGPPVQHFSNYNSSGIYVGHLYPNRPVLQQPPRYPRMPDYAHAAPNGYQARLPSSGNGEFHNPPRYSERQAPDNPYPQAARVEEHISDDEMSIL